MATPLWQCDAPEQKEINKGESSYFYIRPAITEEQLSGFIPALIKPPERCGNTTRRSTCLMSNVVISNHCSEKANQIFYLDFNN